MRILKTSKGCYKVQRIDGEDRYIKITASEYDSLKQAQDIKRGLIKAGGNGVAIAGGMAAGEALLTGGAYAAEAAVVAAEASVVVPIVLTGAAIVGIGALCVWGVQQFTEA
jgi:hypothetical protein